MTNDELYENALKAIKKLFEDTSVSAEEAIVSLNTLIDEIRVMVDSLEV